MSLERRVKQLEKQNGDGRVRIRVCWHGPDEECDCPPADVVIAWGDEDELETQD